MSHALLDECRSCKGKWKPSSVWQNIKWREQISVWDKQLYDFASFVAHITKLKCPKQQGILEAQKHPIWREVRGWWFFLSFQNNMIPFQQFSGQQQVVDSKVHTDNSTLALPVADIISNLERYLWCQQEVKLEARCKRVRVCINRKL